MRGVMRTLRYVRGWSGDADVSASEVEILRDGVPLPATLVLPRRRNGPLPGWIAVGGISKMGRHHPQLARFAKALAASGAAVLVPEIPEWRRLDVSPGVAGPTIRGCIDFLTTRREVQAGKRGLIGFSFGAPQVAIAAAREDLSDHVAGIVLFGAYCCLERTLVCQLTGEHEWEGTDYSLSPDPYGGWVVGSNHLTNVPGFEDAHDVADALYRLAEAASGLRISAWEPHHDEMIEQLRHALPEKRKPLFDLFATPSGCPHRSEQEERRDMAIRLAEACRRVEPLLEPATELAGVHLPTRLIHGQGDRLIPFTESARFMGGLPENTRRNLTVTGLFNHSADRAPAMSNRAREHIRMFGAIRGMINTV